MFQTFSNSGIKLWIDDRLVINHWRQGWLPWKDVAKVRLEAEAPPQAPARVEQGPEHGDGAAPLEAARSVDGPVDPARPPRSGRRSATASTTPSSTGPSWTASSPATAASPVRRR